MTSGTYSLICSNYRLLILRCGPRCLYVGIIVDLPTNKGRWKFNDRRANKSIIEFFTFTFPLLCKKIRCWTIFSLGCDLIGAKQTKTSETLIPRGGFHRLDAYFERQRATGRAIDECHTYLPLFRLWPRFFSSRGFISPGPMSHKNRYRN